MWTIAYNLCVGQCVLPEHVTIIKDFRFDLNLSRSISRLVIHINQSAVMSAGCSLVVTSVLSTIISAVMSDECCDVAFSSGRYTPAAR